MVRVARVRIVRRVLRRWEMSGLVFELVVVVLIGV